jgi:hypothetical protein
MSEPVTRTERSIIPLVLFWLLVGIPLTYGISQTLVKAAKLFTG